MRLFGGARNPKMLRHMKPTLRSGKISLLL